MKMSKSQSKNGFSLIELVIALGVSGITILGFLHYAKVFNKSNSELEKKIDVVTGKLKVL